MKRTATLTCILLLCSLPAFSQQTGSVSGKVTTPDGEALPGVTVEASGDVLPQSRSTVSDPSGAYSLRVLPPGNYQLTFSLAGLRTESVDVRVLLQQNAVVHVKLYPEDFTEEVTVTGEAPPIDTTSAEIKSAVDSAIIEGVPTGQTYRDLMKLIPGVQYTEDGTRGPSAGGNGQDNVYLFDGVNVGLPLFGTLSAEPSSHDIEQVSIIKGGAKAIDFNRSGGFTMNSVSKSGTNSLRGTVSFQIQSEDMTGDRETGSSAEFEEDKDWAVFNIGGPLARDHLHFYTSYYRPTTDRGNRSNLYGEVPDSTSERDEFFGKLSFTPTSSVFLSASQRSSERANAGFRVTDEDKAGTASEGSDADLDIAILEGSWVVSDRSLVSFKYTSYEERGSSRPDNLLDLAIFDDGSVPLDVANLDQQGLFEVPLPVDGADEFNAFIAPLIDQYGFLEGGVPTGGGRVGVASTIDDEDFFRDSFQISLDVAFGKHDLHFGYQWYADEEILSRTSNGWGLITVPGGRDERDGVPVFFRAEFNQQSLRDATGEVLPPISSEFESQSIEANDTISWKEWTLNLGVVLSNDELFGQGLRENSAAESGFELAPGNKYKMHEDDFSDMIQPRIGLTRSLNDGRSSVYANYARYHPAASSLPRAASWGRNLRRTIRAFFDADGNFITSEERRSSSGKFFQDGINPRAIDEYLVGYSTRLTPRLTLKSHARYRYGFNFWEDTNNNARSRFNPPEGVPTDDYIPELGTYRDEVGGSSYVIAELDGAFTKYYEASVDARWQGSKAQLQGSYVWSHYYGNFDQDNTTTENDSSIFLGSSFLADGAGRQIWDNRYGNLRGDRRHQLKLYGFYHLNWDATGGFYAVYQSGQPWEAWNVEVYRDLTGSSSDTSRYAEPAGSRTTSDHYQIDLNYTQNIGLGDRYNLQLRLDLFNVFDKQTGYNIQNKVNSANFGTPRDFFNPRRLQLMVRFEF